jgi:hypothetical protein
MNQVQMKNMFKYFDTYEDQKIKSDIFCRLSCECYKTIKEWVESFQGNVQRFLDFVNIGKKSPWWESLLFNDDKTILNLTGKVVDKCACALGDIENPPKALCSICCKSFQEQIFGTLFNRKVEVEITESSILGGKRCSTAIHIISRI